jgi:hypothetical protein
MKDTVLRSPTLGYLTDTTKGAEAPRLPCLAQCPTPLRKKKQVRKVQLSRKTEKRRLVFRPENSDPEMQKRSWKTG